MSTQTKRKLFITHSTGKKSGKEYFALVLDLGYTQKMLLFGAMACAEVLGIYPNELVEKCPLGSTLNVGEF